MRNAGTRTNLEKILTHFGLFHLTFLWHLQTEMTTELGTCEECVRGQWLLIVWLCMGERKNSAQCILKLKIVDKGERIASLVNVC